MNIRIATELDIPGLLALLRQVGQVHHDIRPDIFPEHTLKYDENALKGLLKDKTRPIFVAVDGHFVAGYCFCVHKDYEAGGTSVPRRELYIDDLCVDSAARGRGVGEKLYRHVCAWAKAQGFDYITLHVWDFPGSAEPFYRKMGMKNRYFCMEQSLEEL